MKEVRDLKINVMDTWAVMVEDDTLRQNSKKTYNVEFNFDKCWDGYSRPALPVSLSL